MRYHHARNATGILELGEHQILIDPMLSEPGTLPGFKMFGGDKRRNPLVSLPEPSREALDRVTAVLITHEHPDHLDKPGVAWIRERGLRVHASSIDVRHLRSRGLEVEEVYDRLLDIPAEVVPGRHGRSIFAFLMGPVSGYYLAAPDEPSVYLTSDSVWSAPVEDAIESLQPNVIVAPAGAANFGKGPDILFPLDETIELVRRAPGQVILNHLEAVDHCPVTRDDLSDRLRSKGLLEKVWIPQDGETREYDAHQGPPRPPRATKRRKPGLQKWLTQLMA